MRAPEPGRRGSLLQLPSQHAVSACELRANLGRERLAARTGEDRPTGLAGMDGDIERTQAPHAFHRFGYRRNARVSRTLTKGP